MIPNFWFFSIVGRPFAITMVMILVIIRMKVLSEKRMELSQTIASLIVSIRTEKGCNRCDFCQNTEDENELWLLEEWDTQENIKSHLKSGRFKVLRGAMNLLKEPYEMMFHTVSHPVGMEGN
jgi:quinol monooxygenase YgiN